MRDVWSKRDMLSSNLNMISSIIVNIFKTRWMMRIITQIVVSGHVLSATPLLAK